MRQSLSFQLLVLGAMVVAPHALAQQYDPFQRGLGAYAAGRAEQAEQFLDEAIEQTPTDPRPYYFRGLARLQLDRGEEATEDLRQGATLELAGEFPPALIERALANVQGSARLTLERVRRETRKAAVVHARTELRERRRAEHEERERQVLRTRFELPIEALVNRLTPEQAKLAATKLEGPEPSDQIAAATTPSGGSAEARPELAEEPNPFEVEPEIEEPPPAAIAAADDDSPFVGDPFTDDIGREPRPTPGGANQQEPVAGTIGGLFRGLGQMLGSGKTPEIPGGLPGTGGGGQPAPFGSAPAGEGFGPPDEEFGGPSDENAFGDESGLGDEGEEPMLPDGDGAEEDDFGSDEGDPFADQE